MGKLNIGKSFRNKKFKYGGYAALLTTIVIAVVVAVNLVVGQLGLKLDLSQNKMFSLSEKTINILKELKSDVKIIGLYEAGKENPMVKEILDKYKGKSSKIVVEYVDPVLHPQFAKQYTKEGQSLSQGSLIVVSGGKHKIIDAYDLYNYDFNQQTFQQTPESLAAEQRLTGAIMYVTSSKNPVVYTLEGHNEGAIPTDITKMMENENYTVNNLNLLTGEWKYENGDILLINSPKRDITNDELKKITDYMAKGGRTVILMDFLDSDMPNLQKLMNTYGLGVQRSAIFEGDTSKMIQNKLFLVPDQKDHDILNPLISSKMPVIVPYAQPIEEIKVRKGSIVIEPLLSTSNKAYAKKDPAKATTLEKESGDIAGPFNIAVASTDKVDELKPEMNSKMVVISSSIVLDPNFIQASGQANADFFMNSINWLVDKKENISISPKSLSVEPINIDVFNALVIAGLVVIVIPLIIAGSGVTVWLRRRHL